MSKGAARITVMSPEGKLITFEGPGLRVEQATAGGNHWTLHRHHRDTENALVGIVPKTWAILLELP
jgi:hypothetical protein